MTLAEIHDADMAFILTDAGNSFTWDGADYACILADVTATKDLHEGGFMPDFDLSIHTRRSLFGDALPAAGDLVTVDSEQYRVIRRRTNFTGKILVLDLQTKEK